MQTLEIDGALVARPLGDLTVDVGHTWRAGLRALERGRPVVIELDGVSFMDSTGLGVLIGAIRRIRSRGGDVAVVSTRAPMQRMLRLAGLDRLVGIADDAGTAQRNLAGQPAPSMRA